MADLVMEPTHLAVRLTRWERLGTFQRDFDIPWDRIAYAEAVSDMWPRVRGWRWPGLGIPHVILIGRMRFRGGQDFCALKGTKPGIVLEVQGGPYARILATTADAPRIVKRVTTGA